jgi:hypothetical protein
MRRFPKVKIVTYDWLEDTLMSRSLQDETPYLWRRIRLNEDKTFIDRVVVGREFPVILFHYLFSTLALLDGSPRHPEADLGMFS